MRECEMEFRNEWVIISEETGIASEEVVIMNGGDYWILDYNFGEYTVIFMIFWQESGKDRAEDARKS